MIKLLSRERKKSVDTWIMFVRKVFAFSTKKIRLLVPPTGVSVLVNSRDFAI